jgi:hypothetical protein
MHLYSRWVSSSLVLLAVFVLAATVPVNGVFLDAVLITVAIGLLIASYALRRRVREQLIYNRGRDDAKGPAGWPPVTDPTRAAPRPRRPAE